MSQRPAAWWREASGAVADVGVLIPIAVALIVSNGLSATAVLLPAGALYLLVAAVFRAPVAVQPLKAFGAVAIAAGAGPDVIAAGALVMGGLFLALGLSGMLDRLAAVFPTAVIRGVQLAVGLTFARIAWDLVTDAPSTFTAQWSVTATALGCLLVTAGLVLWRGASALVVVVVGLAIATTITWWGGNGAVGLGPSAITVPSISAADLLVAATVLVLPQVPLTLTNSCLAPADAAHWYFPDRAARITPGRLARTLGAANIAVAAVGGMPMCHGAGGMSAHHAFGARSWRSPAIIGTALVAVALLLGNDIARILQAYPLALLAALLLVAGITHIRLLRDLQGRRDWGIALAVGVTGAAGYLLVAVVIGLAAAAFVGRLGTRPAQVPSVSTPSNVNLGEARTDQPAR